MAVVVVERSDVADDERAARCLGGMARLSVARQTDPTDSRAVRAGVQQQLVTETARDEHATTAHRHRVRAEQVGRRGAGGAARPRQPPAHTHAPPPVADYDISGLRQR